MDKKELLYITCINAQSLLCHHEAIEEMLQEDEIDILCICETWLDTTIEDKFINITNFKVVRCDAGRGAGVCMYVRKDLKITVINPDIDKINNVDDVWIQVQHRKFPSIIVGCVYRHPRALAASFSYLADVFKYV